MASKTHAPDKNIIKNIESSEVVKKTEQKTQPFQQFFIKFNNDYSMAFAGAIAYSLLTAILPIILAMVSILGLILGSNNVDNIVNQAQNVIPPLKSQHDLITHALKQLSNQAGFLGLIAVILAIFGGSRLFIGLEGFMDIVYRVRPRTFIPQNIMAIIMIIVFIFLVPIMFFAGTFPSIALAFVGNNSFAKGIPLFSFIVKNPVVVVLAGFIGGLIAAFILFEAIYIVVPNQKISLRNSWRGALTAAIALQIFISVVFPFYSSHFLGNYVGQAGLAIVLLVFFYYFAVILMLGAEVNAFFSEHVRPLPNDLITFVSTMGGKLQHDIPDAEAHPHIDPKPTDEADKAHIGEVRKQEENGQAKNGRKQQQPAGTTRTREQAQPTAGKATQTMAQPATGKVTHTTTQPNRLLTIVSVVVGSLLTMVVELMRHRSGK